MAHPYTPEQIDRFWSKVDTSGECWEWTRGTYKDGYGLYSPKQGTNVRAHRFAYTVTRGDIPSGKWVLHDCDNRLCVRPSHLFLGTVIDNNADMKAKDRHARGERNGRARITADDVRAIREQYQQGGSASDMASEFGLSAHHIRRIARRERWSHVD